MEGTVLKRVLALVTAALCLGGALGLVACGSSGDGDAAQDEAGEGSTGGWQEAAGGDGDAEGEDADELELQIYAADEFQAVLPALQELYCEANPDVSFADTRFDSSDDLADRVQAATEADLLLTTSIETMDAAEKSIDPASRIEMCTSELILIMEEGSDESVQDVADVIELEGGIGICDPERMAEGVYALQTLEDADLVECELDEDGDIEEIVWSDALVDKIDAGSEDAEELAVRIAAGELEAGFVCACDLPRLEGVEAVCTAESTSHETIACSGAVLADSENPDLAADFLDFCITDEEARQLLEDYGFDLLG